MSAPTTPATCTPGNGALTGRQHLTETAKQARAADALRERIAAYWLRTGPPICLSYPVAPGQAWRNSLGDTFAEGVFDWLSGHAGDLARLEPGAPRVEGLKLCGLYIPESHGAPGTYLVTLAAMTACVSEQDVEASTPGSLHHALADLVDAGHLAPQVEVCELPGLGAVWCYVLRDQLRDVPGY